MIWLRRFFSLLRVSEQASSAVPPRVFLPVGVAEATAEILTSFRSATGQHEGIAYWAGVPADMAWMITTVVAPTAHTTSGSYQTTAVANAQVISMSDRYHLHILAQVHGHPGEWVSHSRGDARGAFMPYTGFYSIVVPHYGNKGLLPLTICGIHRFQGRQFLRLSPQEIEQQFVVVPQWIDLRRQDDDDRK